MTNPIVKTIKPELYARHVKHMSRAKNFTYNYSVIDDYIKENYYTMTITEMANNLKELRNRVIFRIQVLRENKLLVSKRELPKLEQKKRDLFQQLVKTQEELNQVKAILDNA